MYPPAPKSHVVDDYHGTRVADPFRTLEHADDPATRAWVDAQNAFTRRHLDSPRRDRLIARLRELHRVARASAPAVRGERVFFTESDGTRNQAILYVAPIRGASDRPAGVRSDDPVALVDPNTLDADGTTAITAFEPDAEGARVAYGLSRHGSDLQVLRVRDVARGVDLPDRIEWVKFASIAWWRDAFFYTRYPQPGTVPPEHEQYFCRVWFHRLDDPQAADRQVYGRPDAPEVVFDLDVTSDDRYLVITSRRGASDNAEVHLIRLEADAAADARHAPDTSGFSESEVRPLVTGFESGWHFIDGAGDRLYFRTDAGAPCGRIVRFDLDRPLNEPATIVAESADTIVDSAIAGGRLLVSSLHLASSRLTVWTLDGHDPRDVALGGLATIVGIGATWRDDRAYLTLTSFTMPPTIMACDADAGRATSIRSRALPFDPQQYVTEQVWYRSGDGTRVSMFLVTRRDARGGLAPVLLTGYGGFNISLTPTFDPSDFLWLDAGGTLAVANLRGGGEYGEAWHRAGMRERKQHVFDDFIAAAEWLVARGRATPRQIAIEGGSNGGLLVAAAMIQRPDLFGAVICRVPVADMLRYHRFTVGRFWIPEYGCADDAGDFPFLYRYSPYHHVADGVAYPPTLVMTADTDDRVAPGMAKKFAARLQDAVGGTSGGPILLRVETRAGHGAGKPVTKQIDEQADIYGFLFTHVTTPAVR